MGDQFDLLMSKGWGVFLIFLIFSRSYAFYKLFKSLSLLRSTKLLNTWHAATGKDGHITECTLSVEDTSLIQTRQLGPTVSVT